MISILPEELNSRYSIPGHVHFTNSAGGLVTAEVQNQFSQGGLTLAGGHVISYQPAGYADVFWMSPNSPYAMGKSMRGGIPVCWPWFGPHPKEPARKPAHGFVRGRMWSLKSTRSLEDGSTEVCLTIHDDEETRTIWPYAFELDLKATFGQSFHVDLIVRNTGHELFQYTSALHHYFYVGDSRQITIAGLDGKDYLDKVDQFARKHQSGPIKIQGQTDRIYLDTSDDCVITDPVLRRKIVIAKAGSRTTVVWNPAERAGDMLDVGLGNEKHFVCVETANAAADVITVLPGEETSISADIRVDQMDFET
jgi:D-hexose-6-phosphate mutarotase